MKRAKFFLGFNDSVRDMNDFISKMSKEQEVTDFLYVGGTYCIIYDDGVNK
jgi:hypothetical protein